MLHLWLYEPVEFPVDTLYRLALKGSFNILTNDTIQLKAYVLVPDAFL